MDLQWIFEAIHATPVSRWLEEARWGFATIEMLHLICLGLFGGVLVLRYGPVLLGRQPLVEGLESLWRASLWSISLTGILLVLAEPMKCYFHPAFRFKMLLFFAALLLQPWLSRIPSPRIAAALALLLWTSVGAAGRSIGFL